MPNVRDRRTATAVLYYDGDCGFCDATIQYVLRHDRTGSLHFVPLRGTNAAQLLRRHPRLGTVDSLVWADSDGSAEGERVFIRSDAVLQIARYLGWPWSLAAIGRLVPRVIRDGAYDVFARYRKRVMPMPDSCEIPAPEVRARFLDGHCGSKT
jgi:predicted DCC family thiol-disulfide oxidoreductase YuxK